MTEVSGDDLLHACIHMGCHAVLTSGFAVTQTRKVQGENTMPVRSPSEHDARHTPFRTRCPSYHLQTKEPRRQSPAIRIFSREVPHLESSLPSRPVTADGSQWPRHCKLDSMVSSAPGGCQLACSSAREHVISALQRGQLAVVHHQCTTAHSDNSVAKA